LVLRAKAVRLGDASEAEAINDALATNKKPAPLVGDAGSQVVRPI
jgi:hypothetical protein